MGNKNITESACNISDHERSLQVYERNDEKSEPEDQQKDSNSATPVQHSQGEGKEYEIVDAQKNCR